MMQMEILLHKILENQDNQSTYLLSEKFNADDAAALIGVSKRHLMNLKEHGKISYFQDGRVLKFGRNHIQDYLKSIEYKATI